LIPYGRQSISEEDIQAVLKVLNRIGSRKDRKSKPLNPPSPPIAGSLCGGRFQRHGRFAYRLPGGGSGAGDALWTSPNTFVASANCGLYCGAEIGFVDIDPATGNIDAGKLKSRLEEAKGRGKLPKVVVPVHFAGQPCEMEEIASLSRAYGFKVIEDASHALGADYRGGKIGSCAHSHMTVFSFHPVKIATTGEGGAVLTADAGLHRRILSLRSTVSRVILR